MSPLLWEDQFVVRYRMLIQDEGGFHEGITYGTEEVFSTMEGAQSRAEFLRRLNVADRTIPCLTTGKPAIPAEVRGPFQETVPMAPGRSRHV